MLSNPLLCFLRFTPFLLVHSILMLSNFLFHFLHFMTFLQVHSFHNFNKCEILTATNVMEFVLRTHMDSYVSSHMWQPEFTGTFLPIIAVTSECPLQVSTLGNCLAGCTPLSSPAFKNDQWIMNWKQCEMPSQHLSKRTEGNHGKSQSWQLVFIMIFECRYSWIIGRIDTLSTTTISFPISHK